MKEFIVTKISVIEIQNLVWNPISEPIKSNFEQYRYLFSTFPAKINDKIFKINKKNPYFAVIFVQRKLFL